MPTTYTVNLSASLASFAANVVQPGHMHYAEILNAAVTPWFGFLSTKKAPVPYITATPQTIPTATGGPATTTLNWFSAVATSLLVTYGKPSASTYSLADAQAGGYVIATSGLVPYLNPTQGSAGSLIANGFFTSGGTFYLFDTSAQDPTTGQLSNLQNYLVAQVKVTITNNGITLLSSPNPATSSTGIASSLTITWNAPGMSSVKVAAFSPAGTVVATGGASGSAALSNVLNRTVFYLINTATNQVLTTLLVSVLPPVISLTASPNPVPVSGATYSTTLSWTGGAAASAIMADDPISGVSIATGGTSGSVLVDQTKILNGRVFYLVDTAANKALTQETVTVLYSGTLLTLFGLPVPDAVGALLNPPSGVTPLVFPVDPDYAYQKGREWKTNTLQFTPNLRKQMYILREVPEVTFDIGLAVQEGSLQASASTITKFRKVYGFYLTCQGSATPFFFFDPALWGEADFTPMNYREDPLTRPTSPGTGVNPAPTTGRYVMRFAEDNLSFERFALLLSRASIKLIGRAG